MPQERLAIDGGRAELPEGPPAWPVADEAVLDALTKAYRDGSWGKYYAAASLGLVDKLAELHQVEHVLLCCSGTVGVELALRGVGVGPQDEVILAGYDFPGNFRAIEAIGAVPVVVDIDPTNWCLDPTHLSRAQSPATKAIVVSHLHGGMAPMRAIVDFARAAGAHVVEDACQAPGATLDGRLTGTWGDVGVLSFGGSKLLTAGRGGALLTSDAKIRQRVKIFSERGNTAFPLSELQAAVLIPQLEQLEQRNRQRRRSVERLLSKMSHLPFLGPLNDSMDGSASYYKVPWRWGGDAGPRAGRTEFLAAMQAEGVAIDSGFRGFARRSVRRCHKRGTLINATRAADQTVLLHHPVLLEPEETIDRVARAFAKVVGALVGKTT